MEVELTTGAQALGPRAPGAATRARAGALFAVALAVGVLSAAPAWCLWQTFGLADGLAAIQVRGIAQDPAEAMWFATAHGASRYDGATFRTFTPSDGLVWEDVRAVLPDRAGRIWFGTSRGVSRYDGATWITYTTDEGLASLDVRAILEDHSGAIWFATGFGVSRFDGTTWTSYHQTDGLATNVVTCLFEDHTGTIWFGTDGGGVSRFDGTTWTNYSSVTTSGGIADDQIESLLETRDGAIWVGTKAGGLSRFDGTFWTHFATAGSVALGEVAGLREDRFGALWAAGSAGLSRFDRGTWRTFTTADGLAGSFASALTIDVNGNLWVATEGGVSRYDGESWTSYTDAGLGLWGAQAIFEDRTGDVWMGTPGGGVARYDHSAWTSLTNASTAGGLASNSIAALTQDSTGAMWFGTAAGASRFDGSWVTFTTFDGLAGNNVAAMARDSSGGLWIGTTAGLSRFDGATWTSYTSANGLPADRVRSLCVDAAGGLWCGTTGGVGHLQGATWTTYSVADGLAGNSVYAILQDRTGAMWFGTTSGLSRFDGSTWRTFRIADGLGADWVQSLAQSPDSVVWVGTAGGGVSRFDGTLWRTYTTADGLSDPNVQAAIVERSGSLWFGTPTRAVLYDPARVPPQTVITSPPPVLSPSRLQTIQFAAAFRQVLGIEFSTSLDAGPWSAWLTDNAWVGRDLTDGVHTFRVQARDLLHHVDPTPAASTFEIAATPPVPILTSPVHREAVHDTLVVRGTASALRFKSFRIDLRPAGAASWDSIAGSQTPIVDGVLTRLGTRSLADGDYELRLSVRDTLGLTGFAPVTFIVDNVAPFAAQTTPALVSALDGGDVFTTNREAHVYIPPRGLPGDAVVHLDPNPTSLVPASLPDGATRVSPGYSIALLAVSGDTVQMQKVGILDFAVDPVAAPPGQRLTIYVAGQDSVWRRLGGTIDNGRISTPFSSVGRFALYASSAGATDPGTLLAPSITPRVLSMRGGATSPQVQVGFVLSRAGNVRVTVHNRAGRLVRVVMPGESLSAGTNVVSWDGRDEDRRDVEAGLYFVTVEALGETRTQTLAVVR